jgi:hypothetical protein
MHKREKYSADCWQQQPFAAATGNACKSFAAQMGPLVPLLILSVFHA